MTSTSGLSQSGHTLAYWSQNITDALVIGLVGDRRNIRWGQTAINPCLPGIQISLHSGGYQSNRSPDVALSVLRSTVGAIRDSNLRRSEHSIASL